MASFITVLKLWNANAIAQNANETTQSTDLNPFNAEGFFSMQVEVTGSGNIDLIYLISNDGTNYLTPAGTADIVSAFGATSGPGSDGIDLISFDPPICRYIKFKATEQNADTVAVTLHFCLQ